MNRNIDAAARDVQAAINAARGYLPTNLPSNPTYRKVNPADSPIFMIALTSNVLDKGQMYDAASTIMAQKLSQIAGVGQVTVGGSALPGVRVELNPDRAEQVRHRPRAGADGVGDANANTPKGHFSNGVQTWEVGANDQIFKAVDYAPLIVAYQQWRGGARFRCRRSRRFGGGSAQRRLRQRQAFRAGDHLPPAGRQHHRHGGPHPRRCCRSCRQRFRQSIDMQVAMDQTVTIRASVHDVERTLVISVVLVILVVFLFLRNPRTTFIPSVAVPVSLIGTFGVMYLLGYSLDNLSLMALTISTGFVVDDAIVVIENITRYLEQGMQPYAGGAEGRAGNRLHGADHEHFADRRLHSAAADGRHRGPAVPRIRGDALGGHCGFHGGFADGDAHDVRAPVAGARRRTAGSTGPASAVSIRLWISMAGR